MNEKKKVIYENKKVHGHNYHNFFIMMWEEDCLFHEELQMTWQVVLRLRFPHRDHCQIRSLKAARISGRAGRRTTDRQYRQQACPSTLPLAVLRRRRYAAVVCAVGTNIVF